MNSLNTLNMYTLSVDKDEFFRRLAMLSKENQNFILNKVTELSEAEQKDEELLKAIKLGEESGVSEVEDVKAYIEELYSNAKRKQ